MPDIKICTGRDCPLKETCHRYKAIPSEILQSYFEVPPIVLDFDGTKVECKYYWKENKD